MFHEFMDTWEGQGVLVLLFIACTVFIGCCPVILVSACYAQQRMTGATWMTRGRLCAGA